MKDSVVEITIIIPVFNSEKYLKECLDSIIFNNVGNELEILLIDDGSIDLSPDICDSYSSKYDYIHTYHIENCGAASARNYGMCNASGEYVLFIDSDDYIERTALKKIIEEIKRTHKDMYLLKAYKVYQNGDKVLLNKWQSPSEEYSKEEWMAWFAKMSKYPGSSCDKAIRRSFLEENSIKFEEGRTAEDLLWVLQVILAAETYGVINENYYYYRQNVKTSVTNQISVKKLKNLCHVITSEVAIAKKNMKYDTYIYAMAAYELEVLIYLISKIESVERQEFIVYIKYYLWILRYRNDKRVKIFRGLIKLFGINGCSQILKIGRMIIKR